MRPMPWRERYGCFPAVRGHPIRNTEVAGGRRGHIKKIQTIMFIEIQELKSVLYDYQLQQIIENDTDIAAMAIEAAVEEVRSYLDVRYDCDKIFAATGTDRNALIVEMLKNIALYNIVRLANVDIIYEKARERYDRAVEYFDRVASGKLALRLPLKEDEQGDVQTKFRSGSNPKFNHSF